MCRKIFFLIFLLVGCAARQPAPPPPCAEMFILLPDNYIIELAAGAKIRIDPQVQDMAVFCTADEARARLGATPIQGNWAVYRIQGTSAEIAEVTPLGDYRLATPTEVVDWIPAP